MWRGDNTGKSGTSSDCNAQCNQAEINIGGIKSNWGGGFVNDGNTDKCGRGNKVFCCPDPEYSEVIDGCAYADWYVLFQRFAKKNFFGGILNW